MIYRRQVTATLFNTLTVTLLVSMVFGISCVLPKNYQPGKPFVFRTSVKVNSSQPNDEKQNLELRLNNQLDDSLRVRTITAFMSWKPFAPVYKRLPSPPVFDTINLSRSRVFMISLLNSLGYYAPVVTDTFRIDTVKDQYRTLISFQVTPGKNLRIDSIGYSLLTHDLQAMAMANRAQSLLQVSKPYSKQLVSSEIDRLVELFRNNGYYKISSKNIYAEVDTVAAALIDPTLDPFQQAILLEELTGKRQNPTITVVIKQRPINDSSEIARYSVGKVTLFPDLQILEDTFQVPKSDTTVLNNISIISKYNKFKLPFLARNVYLRPGKLYKQDNYYKTLNRFNTQLGAWQNAVIDLQESDTSDSLVDATIRLYPAKKQKLSINPEASYNTNDILASSLFGVDLNLGLRNRNAFKQSVQTSTNLRGGVEFGSNFIQTTQASLSHNIYFPRLIPASNLIKDWKYENLRTVLNLNASYTERRDFFTVRAVAAAWGYEWNTINKEKKSSRSYVFRLPNIEYANLYKSDSFKRYLDTFPTLNEAFKTGFILSTQFLYSSIKQKGNRANFLRITAEESGGLLGLIPSINRGELFRFVKGDIEYRHHIDFPKTQLAMRVYGGAGLEYGGNHSGNQTLPFYKAYFAGGPGFVGASSMRGWQVRQLGLGSSKFYDTGKSSKLDRFGDIILEGNMEFRFPLGNIFGVKINSAVFTDVGNIWDRHVIDTVQSAQGSDFNIGRFYREFAVDAGTGLRFDFDYFIIRLDWAYKIRDPQRLQYADHWFYDLHLLDGQFQLGINYPF